MSDEDFRNAEAMDRRLSAVHQQFNTEFMYTLNRVAARHDREIMALGMVVLLLICALAYDDIRIRALYDKTTNQESSTTNVRRSSRAQ